MKKNKRGISLIVLIVTIIVIIILAAVVVLTLSKNNPVESARKARFMEDVRSFQDELALSVSKDYVTNKENRNDKFNATEFNDMKNYIPSFTKDYDKKLYVKDDELMYKEDEVTENEKKWLEELGIVTKAKIPVPDGWENYIGEMTDDEVPVPKGFTYAEGTKETGTVIQDDKGNEFVWIPVDNISDYKKDTSFPSNCTPTGDDSLPTGITDETLDVEKYKGFYIGRYEAGVPEGESTPTNKVGIPVSKKDAVVWTNIDYNNAKSSAEQMIKSDYVQTGLLTGKAWDTTCHWIKDYVETIDVNSTLTDSRYYGNHSDSESPANVIGYGTKQTAGYSDVWKTKNIYDLAGNVWEWTNEECSSNRDYRGGSYYNGAKYYPVSYRYKFNSGYSNDGIGMRPRLYIKTN